MTKKNINQNAKEALNNIYILIKKYCIIIIKLNN